MGAFGRLLRRREAGALIPHLRDQVYWNGLSSVTIFPSSLAARWASSSLRNAAPSRPREQEQERTVAVFWDLDNKPPKTVTPFEAATRLKELASRFGDVVDLVAYANHHAFAHVPTWVQEERKQRKVLDLLEATGEVTASEPYVCGVCGSKKKTHVQLTKHFKMLHEKEHQKRMNRLDSLKSKKRQKERFLENNSKKMVKYKEASRSIIYPKVGYGLMQDIRRAGVFVRTVKDEPQAADIALKEHMARSIKKGVRCICLVSDDTDFKPELRMARERRLHTVVVGDLKILRAYADTYFSWAEVASGRAEQKAKLINGHLVLGEMPASESCDTVGDYEPEEVPEGEDSELEVDTDGDLRWSPMHRHERHELDDGFDPFSEEFSGSDVEESAIECKTEGQPNLHARLSRSACGINSRVSTRWRCYTTKREIVRKEESRNERSSIAEKGTTSNAPKRERLHHVFTMLKTANRENAIVSKKQLNAGDGMNTEHFNRVQDILRSSPSVKEKTVPGSNGVGEKTGSQSEELKEDELDFFGPEKEGENLYLNEEQEIPSSSGSGYKVGNPESAKQQMPRKHKRTGPGKARIKMTRTGPVKITRIGPRPFHLSGFASEARKDCNAVNKYYAEWWCDDIEIYRGRQDRKRKK